MRGEGTGLAVKIFSISAVIWQLVKLVENKAKNIWLKTGAGLSLPTLKNHHPVK